MASIYDLKPKFQALLRPVVGGLARAGVTANAVTLAACVLSLAYGGAIGAWAPGGGAPWLLLAMPVVLFVRMAMNAVDGMLAREHDQRTPLGALLNEACDIVSDAGLYLPLAWIAGLSGPLVVLAVVLGLAAECVGLAAVQIGSSRRYDGPFGKSDRAVFFGVLAVLLGLGVAPGLWSDIALTGAALAGAATMVNRGRAALREARHG